MFTITLVIDRPEGHRGAHGRHQLAEDKLFDRIAEAVAAEGLTLEFGSAALGVSHEAKRLGFEETA